MDTRLALIVGVAAIAATLARLITWERGPFAIFADTRRLFHMTALGRGWLGTEVKAVMTCPYCMSVWFVWPTHLLFFSGTNWLIYTVLSVCCAWLILGQMRLSHDPDDNPPGLIFAIYRKVKSWSAKPNE